MAEVIDKRCRHVVIDQIDSSKCAECSMKNEIETNELNTQFANNGTITTNAFCNVTVL